MEQRIVVRPLLEKNMFNAKEGEIILDKNTGHITFRHNGKFKSKTKELEARVNALLSYKNELVKKYIELADLIEELVNGFDKIKSTVKDINTEIERLNGELLKLDADIQKLLTDIDNFCLEIKTFQYRDIRPYLNPIIDNLRDLIRIRAYLDELAFLANDIKSQKISNKGGMNIIGGGV